jgi:hypothetical protein
VMNSRAIYSANPSREKSSKQDFLRAQGKREFAAWADHIKSLAILAIAGLSLDAAVQMCLVL